MDSIKGFILYVDILGYKDLLKNSDKKDRERVMNLLTQFTTIYYALDFNLGYGAAFEESKFFKRFFSDNFLFVYESSENDYMNLLRMQAIASEIQTQFLRLGILTRGSITYGEIFHTDEIVFGCDLIKAVELEGHPEPSIVVDEKFEKLLKDNGCEYQKHNSMFSVHGGSQPDLEDILEGIQKWLGNLKKTVPDKGKIEKIQWVISRLNEHFSSLGKEYYLTVDYRLDKK